MADCFNSLRSNTIISSNYQNGDVSDSRSPCPHRCESFVTRSVEEDNLLHLAFMLNIHMVSTNVLGDSTRFTLRHFSRPNGIKEGGFPMIDVTHNRDDWWTSLEVFQVFCIQPFCAFDCGSGFFSCLDFNPQFFSHHSG